MRAPSSTRQTRGSFVRRGVLAAAVVLGTVASGTISASAGPAERPGPAVQRAVVMFAPGAADLDDAARAQVTAVMDAVPGSAAPGVTASVVAFVMRCRVRGDVCTDRALARQRADNVAAILRGRGIDVRTTVRIAAADRGDSVAIALRYRVKPTATWTVVNESTDAAPFEMIVEWATPSGGGVTSLGPGERVRADFVALTNGQGRVTMRILSADPSLRVEIRMNGFSGSPLCERPVTDGTPFTCVARGERGTLRVRPV